MAGDHFRHRDHGFLKGFGLDVGVAADFHADEHRETETEPVSLQHGSISFDVTVALEPFDAAQARRWRKAHPRCQLQVGQASVRLQGGNDAAVDEVEIRVWHKSLISAFRYL